MSTIIVRLVECHYEGRASKWTCLTRNIQYSVTSGWGWDGEREKKREGGREDKNTNQLVGFFPSYVSLPLSTTSPCSAIVTLP
jgi:hypothetical protein